MALVIEPEDGEYLSLQETVDVLQKEFGRVEVDAERARREAENRIERLERQKARGAVEWPYDDEIKALRESMDARLFVTIADQGILEGGHLAIILEEDKPIVIGFESYDHERKAAAIARRCADALGYEYDER